jgi:predicted small lipoprotein YifL
MSARLPLTTAALVALGLVACGQKGALYLPDKAGAVVTTPAGTPPAPPSGNSAYGAPAPETPVGAPTPSGEIAPSRQTDSNKDKTVPRADK